MTSLLTILLSLAILLVIGTIVISWLKSLQRGYFQKWTFLDYISAGYARHLYVKYIRRQ